MKIAAVEFTVFALGLTNVAHAAQAQAISFFREFTTPSINRAAAVAADASGVYVLGERWSVERQKGSAAIRKYDVRGDELWTREIDVPVESRVTIARMAADNSGVYLAIGTFSPSAGASGRLLRKYSSSGDELWTIRLEFFPWALAVDTTGIYVSGSDELLSGSYLKKLSRDGVELWMRRWGEPNSSYSPLSVAVDATGVYLIGIAGMFGPNNIRSFEFVRKYDLQGNELWTRELGPLSGSVPVAAAHSTGFYVISDGLRKYDSDGVEIWRRAGVAGSMITADASGVYVAGFMYYAPHNPSSVPGQCASGSGGDSFLRKFNTNGIEVWARQFGTSQATWAAGIATDVEGVYVVGEEGAAQVRDDLEHLDAFAPANPTRSAFLARFDKATPVAAVTGPHIFPGCVVNAASYIGGGVAPGEIVTIFGSAIGPPELAPLRVTEDRKLATTLADTRILFNGIPAPLMYVSDKQSSAIVPYGVAQHTSVDVQVEYRGVRSESMLIPVLASRPGIFSIDGSGRGQGAILNEDGTLNSPSNPARRGSVVTLYATGGGEAAPGVEDGQILGSVLTRTSLPVAVMFDLTSNEFQGPTRSAEVLYAGGVPGSVAGLLQINLRVPANVIRTGAVSFLLSIGSHWTVHNVTLSIR